MAKADITLRGRNYSIACAPGQETRIVALSQQLDKRVQHIASAVGLLLITALSLLDELDAARRAAGGAPEAEAKVAGLVATMAERIEALAARLESGG